MYVFVEYGIKRKIVHTVDEFIVEEVLRSKFGIAEENAILIQKQVS